MKSVLTIAKREIHSFFVSTTAYVVLFVWLLLQGISLYLFALFFATQQNQAGAVSQTPLTMFFGGSSLFYVGLLVIVPLLTMRLVAEERRSGTIEPLLTTPISEAQIVLGKYVAAMTLWVVLWLPTVLYVWIVSQYGEVDLGVVAASYAGVLGIGLYYMGLGLLMSTIARSQIVAAVLTVLALLGLFLIGVFEFVVDDPEMREIVGYVSVWRHMEHFAKGIVDSRFVAFEVSVAALSVYAAIRVLEARRYE